jgi:hypothetical protein
VEELSKKQRFLSVVRTKDGKNIGTTIVCRLCDTMVVWLRKAIMDPSAYAHAAIKEAIFNALTETCQALPILDAQVNKCGKVRKTNR